MALRFFMIRVACEHSGRRGETLSRPRDVRRVRGPRCTYDAMVRIWMLVLLT